MIIAQAIPAKVLRINEYTNESLLNETINESEIITISNDESCEFTVEPYNNSSILKILFY